MNVKSLIPFLLALPLFAQPPSSITVQERTASTQTNRPITVSRVFARGEITTFPQAVISGTPVATQADIKTRWSDGSVQHAMLSFVAPSLSASSTTTVTFQAQSSGNNTGQMNRAAMLAATWGAQIEATNGTLQSASARQIVTDWAGTSGDLRVRYWLQGAICTQVIVEDRTPTLLYDMGWDAFKPLHPIFVVTFYPGATTAVKVEMILENMWTTKLEDQSYSLALKTGNPLGANVFTKATFTHAARTRWHKVFWNGTQPGAINIDFNLAYMAYSQALPNFDLSQSSSSTGDIAAFNASDRGDINGHAMVLQAMPTTGGRPDIGNFPAWYARYIHTFDPAGGVAMMTGLADVESYIPIHMRESATNRFYDSSHLVNAFGYQWSLDARPAAPLAPDTITPVGPTSNNGWAYDIAHEPMLTYIPYLLTGDWYYLEEMYFMAQTGIQVAPPGFCTYCRGDQFGYMSYNNQMRGQAWGYRDLAEAAFMAPDGTPEKTYFTQKLNTNIEIEEGHQSITNGSFPPVDPACPGYVPSATTSKWCFGRKVAALNPDKFTTLTNPLVFTSWGNASTGCGESHVTPAGNPAFQCINSNSPWQNGFLFVEYGHIQELGFPIGPLNQKSMKFLLHMLQDPAFNPYLSSTYVMPTIRNSTNDFYQNWGDVLSGFATAWSCGGTTYNLQTFQGWAENCSSSGSGDSNLGSPGYPHIMQGAASYLAGLGVNDGPLLGLNAWNWMVSHVGFQTGFGVNPQFAILPRSLTPPCTISGSLPSGIVGTGYGTATLAAQSCGGNTLTWTITTGALPGGLSGCNGVTGTTCSITGTPTTTIGSPFSFTIRVTDGATNTAFSSFTVAITSPNTPPVITSTSPLPNGALGTPYSFRFAANGTAPITWTATGLPGWATLSSDGLLSGTPNAVAVSTIAVTATNIAGSAGPTNFSLTIPGVVPTITSTSPLPGGTTTVPYSFQFAATGTTPITWGATGLPAWAALSSTGLLTGTPNVVANTTIAVTATNATGNSGPHNFTLNVVAVLVAPTITSTSPLPNATFGSPYSFQFAANGTAPITWSATALPAWASLSGSGLLSGTPNAVGTSTISVTATNSAGSAGPANFSLTVPGVSPTITSASPLPGGTATISYSFQFTASGSPIPTWTATSVPAGLTFSAGGLLSGTPTVAGTTSINVTATNSAGSAGPTSFSLNIAPAPGGAPSITSTSPLPNCVNGTPYSFQFQSSGTVPFTWSGGSSIPSGFSLSSSGLLTGTTTTLGAYTLTISVSNAAGSAGPVNFSFTVVAPSAAPFITSTSPLATGLLGTPYSNQIAVTGNPVPTCTATGLPGWATLSSGCLLTGIPNVAGSTVIAITATNSFGVAGPTNFTLPVNQVPSFITTSPLPSGTNGTSYSLQFQSNGTPTPSYSATGVPAGLTLSSSGLLSGIPTVNATGNIAVTITNAAGSAGPTNFSLTVNPAGTAPTITTTSPLPNAVVGQSYSVQFTGTGSPATWTATGLPTWATLTTAGLLSGTPDIAGTSTVAVTLTNGFGAAGPTSFSLPVLAVPLIVTMNSQIPGGTVGTPFSFQFVVSGTPAPTCSATGLPGWASLSSSCLLTGTPNVSGNTTFAITAANSIGTAGPTNFTLAIVTSVIAPLITSTSPLPQTTIIAPSYSFTFAASGTAPLTWTVTAGTLPAGLSLDGPTGILSGDPNTAAVSSFTITATNAAGSDSKAFSLTVTAATLDYTLSSTGPHHVVVGHYLFFNVLGAVTVGVDEMATTSISGLPSGASAVFVNQIAVCCGPNAPGINGLNPIKITVTGGATPGSYPLTVTYDSVTSHVIHTAPYTLIIDPVPGPLTTVPFPANVPLAGLAQYNANMLSFGTTYCTPPLGGPAFEGFFWYYDATRVVWQIADYTSNPSTWNPCALAMDALYRAYVLQTPPTWTGSAGNIPGYHVFPKGLAMSYVRAGITADKTAIQYMRSLGYANPSNIAPTIDWLLSREMSYGLETNLEARTVGLSDLPTFQDVVEVLIGDMDQWFQSQSANYVQPFMVALASEALIQYYEATGDIRVPPLIKLAADQLWSVSFDPLSNSMMYYNYNASLGAPPPQPYPYLTNCSNLPSFSFTCKGPSPDLNLLIVPVFGWVYQHTGDVTYRNHGDTLFNAGVNGGFLGAGKQFSQNYRWSMRYLTDRLSVQGCDLNQDGKVNVQDTQLVVNMSLGLMPCTANINGAGVCNSVTISRVVTASLGGACQLGP